MRLTDQTVRSLPRPETGQCDYADDAVPGLIVRVGTRAKTFVLTTGTRRGGNRKRHTLGRYDPPNFTLAMAREKARDITARQRLGKDEAPSRTTFNEALEIYYRVHVSGLRAASDRNIRQSLDRIFRPTLGKKPLTEIRRTDIAPLLDTLLDRPWMRESAFRHLRAFINWCVTRGYLEGAFTDRMETPQRPPSRDRVLTPIELIAVWNAAPDADYGRILKLCILSGQRRKQWGAMRREYIQGDTVVFPASLMKSGKEHTLPLTPGMKVLLPDRIGYLFPNANAIHFTNWANNKDRLIVDSGVQNLTLHDLRRTWATIAAEELDIQPHVIESVLSHAYGTGVARTYNRAKYLEPMRKALLAFEEWLNTQIRNTGGGNVGRQLRTTHSERA
jgi:integrase